MSRCSAVQPSGHPCTNPAKVGELCGVHARQHERQASRLAAQARRADAVAAAAARMNAPPAEMWCRYRELGEAVLGALRAGVHPQSVERCVMGQRPEYAIPVRQLCRTLKPHLNDGDEASEAVFNWQDSEWLAGAADRKVAHYEAALTRIALGRPHPDVGDDPRAIAALALEEGGDA